MNGVVGWMRCLKHEQLKGKSMLDEGVNDGRLRGNGRLDGRLDEGKSQKNCC